MTAMVKYTQTQLEQEEVEGLTRCVRCGNMAFNGRYCLWCAYPGKVRDRRKKKK